MSQNALLRAVTRDGISLPVINITQPENDNTEPHNHKPKETNTQHTLFDRAAEDARRHQRLPQFIMRFILRRAARQSQILRALFVGDGSFLDGITTYVMKLGAEHLPPPFDSPTDRRVAASAQLKLLRLRTQQLE